MARLIDATSRSVHGRAYVENRADARLPGSGVMRGRRLAEHLMRVPDVPMPKSYRFAPDGARVRSDHDAPSTAE